MTTGRINQVNGATLDIVPRSIRYGKQRCKTSNMTVSYENMNLQIRSMFDAEPTSAELISSGKRFVKRPCHQCNAQASNATPCKRMAVEKRTPNTTHHRSSRIAPAGGMPKLPKGVTTHPKKKKALTLFHTKKKTNLHRSRVPAYMHNLMTAFDISVELRYVSIKNWTALGACFDHTHIIDMMHLE